MQEYGIINESGFLRTIELRETKEQHRENGEIKTKTVSIEEQAERYMAQGWKPVDLLENEKMKASDGYVVRITPYDNGDRISFKYEQIKDTLKIKKEIAALKQSLSDSDYKIIKCYETALLGDELPYNITDLHTERQSIRDKINELEENL